MRRRQVLGGLLAAGGALVAGEARSEPKRRREPDPEAVGLLFDSTRCVGCKTCVVACREANDLEPEPAPDGARLYDHQTELNGRTKTVIKLYRDPADPGVHAFMKQQCMHCIDPACVSACQISAFQKSAKGIVTYDASKCIGCRYCQVACPFDVPKFEWEKAIGGKIVKCELCKERVAEGKEPACAEVCPRQAVIFGKLDDLLTDAHARIAAHPELYQPKVYGEEEAGGTQVLYLSSAAIPFEKLGLPKLSSTSLPYLSETLQHGLYQGFLTPAVLYVALAVAAVRNWRKINESGAEDESKHDHDLPAAPGQRRHA